VGAQWPSDLKVFLRESNGFEDTEGQWEVAWSVERIVAENGRIRRESPNFPARWLCFGDNGAGDAFAIDCERGTVHVALASTGEYSILADSLSEFWRGWFSGDITT
jgi:hypothetical protein